MLAVYILSGKYAGSYGYLFSIDGRTSEVVCKDSIVRVDTCLLQPLDYATSFDQIEEMVNKRKIEKE